jgi:hypothetical protein
VDWHIREFNISRNEFDIIRSNQVVILSSDPLSVVEESLISNRFKMEKVLKFAESFVAAFFSPVYDYVSFFSNDNLNLVAAALKKVLQELFVSEGFSKLQHEIFKLISGVLCLLEAAFWDHRNDNFSVNWIIWSFCLILHLL